MAMDEATARQIQELLSILPQLGQAGQQAQENQSFIDPMTAVRAMEQPVLPWFHPGGTGRVHFMGGSPFPSQRPTGAGIIESAALFNNIMGVLDSVMKKRRQSQAAAAPVAEAPLG